MGYVNGVNLLPSTGEFTYATTAHQGARLAFPALPLVPINIYYDTFNGGAFPKTDYAYSIDQLQAAFPSCTTIAVVCAWFGNSENAVACQIYPSTTYIGGSFTKWIGSSYVTDHWMVSSLTETSSGLIPISSSGGSFTYGGTPSDQSIVECISDLKARGFRVVFYPFILMDAPGKPWRGRITYSPDVSSVAASAVATFLGSAATSQFTRDYINNTVSYAGSLPILLIGAWCCITLICALLLAESIYFLLALNFAAWKQYAVRGGQLLARLTEVARQFGIIPSSPE